MGSRVSPAPAWGENGTMYVNKYQQGGDGDGCSVPLEKGEGWLGQPVPAWGSLHAACCPHGPHMLICLIPVPPWRPMLLASFYRLG